jgi:hypothetical protein
LQVSGTGIETEATHEGFQVETALSISSGALADYSLTTLEGTTATVVISPASATANVSAVFYDAEADFEHILHLEPVPGSVGTYTATLGANTLSVGTFTVYYTASTSTLGAATSTDATPLVITQGNEGVTWNMSDSVTIHPYSTVDSDGQITYGTAVTTACRIEYMSRRDIESLGYTTTRPRKIFLPASVSVSEKDKVVFGDEAGDPWEPVKAVREYHHRGSDTVWFKVVLT